VLDDLVRLRSGAGLTVEKLRDTRTLHDLPMFAQLDPTERPTAIYDEIIVWLRSYEHAQRRIAIVSAFALDRDTLVGLPDIERTKLERRRAKLSEEIHGSMQNVRDREDDALSDLAHYWLERSIDTLKADVEEGAAARSIGLVDITLDFYRGVDWEGMLRSAIELDVFFTYGRSWRRTLTRELSVFFARGDVSTRVVLPDLRTPRTTALPEIAKRAGQDIDTLRSNIAGAYGYFAARRARLWASDAAELYGMYRMDSLMVVTIYNHQRGYSEGVPSLITSRDSDMFNWFMADFNAIIEKPLLSRPVSSVEAKLWEKHDGRVEAEAEMEDSS
jgi:hypothetical protein